MLHQIGIGTLGPVFRTYEPTRDRLVAVKVFRLDIVPEQAHALAAALRRAVEASLFHPSIVEPLDAGVEGTLAYRAEDYVAAESLDVALRHYAPAPIEKVLPFITQLGGAIDFARAAGIGHGGLHPRDIFVTPDDARATGFGVVDALEQVGIRAPIRRPYSAPERIDGTAWGTPADVFSLAAITFELLTAKRPSGTGARIGTLPETPYSAAMHTVLARAMDDDPAKRYASALAFAGALEAASQGRPLTDAVSQVAAIAAAPMPEPPAVEPLIDGTTAADPPVNEPLVTEPEVDAIRAAEAAIPATLAFDAEDFAPAPVAAPTPGEFAIEEALDPLHAAIEEETPRFSDDFTEPAERFADDFAVDQEAEGDMRSPLEDENPLQEPVEPLAETAMYQPVDPADDPVEAAERDRPAILPFALFAVLGLLIGFGAGYFVRGRAATPTTADVSQPAGTTASPAAPAGVATADQPGQYSEQKVTAPAPAPPSDTTATAPAATSPSSVTRPAPPVETPRTEPAATKGEIVVRSLPSHAGVMVNGTWRGRTPLTLGNLGFGSYAIRVVQPGYKPARDEATLSARAPSHTFTTRLERTAAAAPPVAAPAKPAPAPTPASFTGSLYVDSRPRGATVLVDGRPAGQTPLTLEGISIGSHVVRIEMAGKKTWSSSTRVVAGQTARVTGSLEDKQEAQAAASQARREPAPGAPNAQRAWGSVAGPRASEGRQ